MKHKSTLALLTLTGMVWGCAGTPPDDLGIHNGQLRSCPSSPNCVNSQSPEADEKHAIAPLGYTDSQPQACNTLLSILKEWPRATLIEQRDDYIRCEFSSAVMGFVDDVEFYFSAPGRIDVRSASRLGHSDLGVNRKRIEAIREKFAAALP
ncbi:DUF1499 domain-containing protein [Desulfuromonas acetoxidans]|uniref:Uncharacterized protein n=1 Tax=Desulfuromonas acetoxidans (strain DSM 684 / 11070) TaxID=281689 RepID=Q1K3C8_DESA6|nr:DUF1499 domain-containing protein [Desulfuromonas acetoxidans]EAT17046.1 protein of unknown function DUF1499 [Desulfuromonas acetoxidans DSM 684]